MLDEELRLYEGLVGVVPCIFFVLIVQPGQYVSFSLQNLPLYIDFMDPLGNTKLKRALLQYSNQSIVILKNFLI